MTGQDRDGDQRQLAGFIDALDGCMEILHALGEEEPLDRCQVMEALAVVNRYVREFKFATRGWLGSEIRNESFEVLELSVRAYNCLKNMSVETIGDVADLTKEELLRSQNFGRESLKNVMECLAKYGLSLAVPESRFTLSWFTDCGNMDCGKKTSYHCDFCSSPMCVHHQKAHRQLCHMIEEQPAGK